MLKFNKLYNQIINQNSNLRTIQLNLTNYDQYYYKSAMSIYNALSKAEGIKSTIKKSFRDNLASFIFKYIGDSTKLIEYLKEHIKSDIKLGKLRPTLTNSNDNNITFKYK